MIYQGKNQILNTKWVLLQEKDVYLHLLVESAGENDLFREQVLQGHDTYEITAVFIVSQPVCSD